MTRAERVAAALTKFDRHMVEATGHTFERYEYVRAAGPTCLEHVMLYGQLIDESGIVEYLEECDRKDRKSNAGRPPQLRFRTVLVLLMMHVDAGDARYRAMAKTLLARTTPATRAYLGLPTLLSNEKQWYGRVARSLNRILDLMEPWEVSKRHHITAEEFRAAKASYSQEKRDRAEEVTNMLLHATVRRLPTEIMDRYKGNVAIDATPIYLVGRANSRWGADEKERWNLDGMSTPYTREGSHEGDGSRTDEPAWELETVVTVANKPGDPLSFPVLMTGASMQHPGRNKYGPLRAVRQHSKMFDRMRRFRLMADQMYNYFVPERFQNEIRKLGFRGVWNFEGKGRGGIRGFFEDAVCADGHLYLKWMPRDLAVATTDYEEGKLTRDEYLAKLASRSKYALKDHGRPDEDGFQRFTYPPITRDMMLFDPATGERLKRTPKLAKKSLEIGPNTKEGMRIIKHLSAVEFLSEEWHAWFGLRNRVEENNQWFKGDSGTDIGNPEKRRAVGYAYNSLVVGMAAAVSNMRRIVSHIEAEALEVVDRPTMRKRRRLDIDGNPLEHMDALAA
ncbi:hypothetical protein [Microbacterium oleivorans]|uniref:hypothetical protein n=1 Tax=Microbacterium oleivorans TaxID=273677 RepID=UPI00080DAD77|nr:hypothetical protein [Microbacterium oleivorans]